MTRRHFWAEKWVGKINPTLQEKQRRDFEPERDVESQMEEEKRRRVVRGIRRREGSDESIGEKIQTTF